MSQPNVVTSQNSELPPPVVKTIQTPEQAPNGLWTNHWMEDSTLREKDLTGDWLSAVLMWRGCRLSKRWQGSGGSPHPSLFPEGNPVIGMGWFVDGIDQCAVDTPDDCRIAKWWPSFVEPSSFSHALISFYLYRPIGELSPFPAAGWPSNTKVVSLVF